jgi:hypothetical protein
VLLVLDWSWIDRIPLWAALVEACGLPVVVVGGIWILKRGKLRDKLRERRSVVGRLRRSPGGKERQAKDGDEASDIRHEEGR